MPLEAGAPRELLRIQGLHAWYGESHVLHGIDLGVHEGELVTLLGRNGAGRSTTLKAILGLVGRRSGSIRVNGHETIGQPSHRIARLGRLGYCPEDRGIFASLSVEENLHLPPVLASGGLGLDEIYVMFHNLYERRRSTGTQLSGGEQQMLAIARALLVKPRLLLLDEPSFGLAPLIVQEIFHILRRINAEERTSILVVEQNASLALDLADHAFLLETGRIVVSGTASAIRQDEAVRRSYLGY